MEARVVVRVAQAVHPTHPDPRPLPPASLSQLFSRVRGPALHVAMLGLVGIEVCISSGYEVLATSGPASFLRQIYAHKTVRELASNKNWEILCCVRVLYDAAVLPVRACIRPMSDEDTDLTGN